MRELTHDACTQTLRHFSSVCKGVRAVVFPQTLTCLDLPLGELVITNAMLQEIKVETLGHVRGVRIMFQAVDKHRQATSVELAELYDQTVRICTALQNLKFLDLYIILPERVGDTSSTELLEAFLDSYLCKLFRTCIKVLATNKPNLCIRLALGLSSDEDILCTSVGTILDMLPNHSPRKPEIFLRSHARFKQPEIRLLHQAAPNKKAFVEVILKHRGSFARSVQVLQVYGPISKLSTSMSDFCNNVTLYMASAQSTLAILHISGDGFPMHMAILNLSNLHYLELEGITPDDLLLLLQVLRCPKLESIWIWLSLPPSSNHLSGPAMTRFIDTSPSLSKLRLSIRSSMSLWSFAAGSLETFARVLQDRNIRIRLDHLSSRTARMRDGPLFFRSTPSFLRPLFQILQFNITDFLQVTSSKVVSQKYSNVTALNLSVFPTVDVSLSRPTRYILKSLDLPCLGEIFISFVEQTHENICKILDNILEQIDRYPSLRSITVSLPGKRHPPRWFKERCERNGILIIPVECLTA